MNTTRKFATWVDYSKVEIVEGPIPEIGPSEALLKVESCAICGSDIRIFEHGNARVAPGQIVGHEISGVIHKVGKEVTNFSPGDRVSLGADVPCGNCHFCSSGNSNCCEVNYAIGHQFEGGFSTFMLLNELTLKKGPIKLIDDNTDFDIAALAEPLACCINGYEHCNIDRNYPKSVAIFGAGPIGLMLGMLASNFYKIKEILIIDPIESKRVIAKSIIPNAETLDPKDIDSFKSTKGAASSFDIVFTAAPSINAQKMAVSIVNTRGYVNFFGGLPKGSEPISIDSNNIHYKEIFITGSHGSTPLQHKKAIEIIESSILPLEELITHRLGLKDLLLGYELIKKGKAIKIIVKPNLQE